jgi:hypothetical protein
MVISTMPHSSLQLPDATARLRCSPKGARPPVVCIGTLYIETLFHLMIMRKYELSEQSPFCVLAYQLVYLLPI